ncbi:MAG: MFS transporter [Lysobacter sp.]|nr:MFS transporter [Lysobacter sp.]
MQRGRGDDAGNGELKYNAGQAPPPAARNSTAMDASGHVRPTVRIPRAIWALGFVSLFMDASSELVHSLLPVYLAGTLGASAFAIGMIEGTAEALALIVKVFSGYLSDALGKRKPLVLLGYGLAAVVKPLFPLAGSVGMVVTARFIDRIGKGIRGAPRDALIGDLAPPEVRGASFGLRQSMDTVGAVIGPLLAIGLMLVFVGDIRTVLWFAVPPAVIAVALVLFAVREPADSVQKAARLPISRAGLASLGSPYWRIVVVGGLLSLARFSEAFLVLRASERGLSNSYVPLVLVVMSLVYTLTAYPAGRLSDRMSRRSLLLVGIALLIAADAVLAVAQTPVVVFAGVALWGAHMGMTQGLLATLIADVAPPQHRGTAFGMFNLASGIALLVASALAGLLWDQGGASLTFVVGGCIAALAWLAALVVLPASATMRAA